MNSHSTIITLCSIGVIGPESIKFHRCYAITLSDVAIKTNTLPSFTLHTLLRIAELKCINCQLWIFPASFIPWKKVNPYLLHKERLKLTVSQLISAGPWSDTSHLQDRVEHCSDPRS